MNSLCAESVSGLGRVRRGDWNYNPLVEALKQKRAAARLYRATHPPDWLYADDASVAGLAAVSQKKSFDPRAPHLFSLVSRLGDPETEPEDTTQTRIEIGARGGEVTRTRRNVEPGESYISRTGYRKSWPVTPNADERNLPRYGEPVPILPVQIFPGSFPHGWIPYEKLKVNATAEMGPTPSGWEPPIYVSREQDAALDWSLPGPWVPEEAMTTDISGFSTLLGALHCLHAFADDETDAATQAMIDEETKAAAAQAITTQAAAAGAQTAAAGGSTFDVTKIINSAIDFGTKVAVAVITKPKAAAATPSVAAKTVSTLFPASEPIYKQPLFIVGAVALLGAGAYFAFSGGGTPTRRRGSRRRRR
jgi:hypothetical protein